MADLRYPVGKFQPPAHPTAEWREQAIRVLETAPANFRRAVANLTEAQLDTPYREGGWTLRQVVHHTADSHINSYVRFKLAVTEDLPVIKPYEEQLWAEHVDGKSLPVDVSLDLLDRLHSRWTVFLRSLTSAEWERRLTHPVNGTMTLHVLLALYDWHSRHHAAHITVLRDAKGWKDYDELVWH
jgi:uncharacterized damage-inducible protein DinB